MNYACKIGQTGAVLGIQVTYLEDIAYKKDISKNKEYPDIWLYDVLYQKREIETRFKHYITELYRLRKQDDPTNRIIRKAVINMLANYSLCYKSNEYALEEETRIVINKDMIDLEKSSGIIEPNFDDGKRLHLYLPCLSVYSKRKVILEGTNIRYIDY